MLQKGIYIDRVQCTIALDLVSLNYSSIFKQTKNKRQNDAISVHDEIRRALNKLAKNIVYSVDCTLSKL